MKEFFPRQPFFERHECFASLIRGNQLAEGLHVIIEYPLHIQGDIVGHVIGNRATYDKIHAVSHIKGPGIRFESQSGKHSPYDITSAHVRVHESSRRYIATDLQGTSTYVVSELLFNEIYIKQHLGTRQSIDRHLTFFLAGPSTFWGTLEVVEQSPTGDRKSVVHNKQIHLAEEFPFTIEVYPHHLYAKTEAPESYEVSTRVFAVDFHTSKSREELNDDKFEEESKSILEDLLLLASFASKKWISWFRFQLLTQDFILNSIRRTRETTGTAADYFDLLIEPEQGRDFLKSAFTSLRTLRAKGFNLFMPLVYYISGCEAKYVEEQFAILFLALERLKDMFVRSAGRLSQVLPDEEFRKLEDAIRALIHDRVEGAEQRRLIYEKIRELNRPALNTVLQWMIDESAIKVKDLYPESAESSLVRSRDQLFHSSDELDRDYLGKELHRLKALLERFLLSMMGWRDFSRSPMPYERDWLVGGI
jgi:hypothetical protein